MCIRDSYRFEEEFWPDPKAMVAELKSMGMQCMVSDRKSVV